MEKVKRLVEAGASVPTALKEALGMSLTAFVAAHPGLVREEISGVVNLRIVPDDDQAVAFAAEYGCTPVEFREFWWTYARRSEAGVTR